MNRGDFLKLSGGIAMTGLTSNSILASLTNFEEPTRIKTFGLQLYTLRDDFPKNPKAVLKQVAEFGYKQIESFEGPKGMFWGMTNKEFHSYLDEIGMKIVASHCDITKDFDRKVEEAAAIEMKYLICPWVGPQKKIDNFKKIADDFNVKGEQCRKNGIRFAYHNHNYSFELLEGQLPQNVLMDNTDPNLVDFEMDIYWVATAKSDPEVWLKKYKNRFRLCHIKDRKKNSHERDASCDLGTGSIDFSKILKTASQNGMKYFIVEQEKYEGTTPLQSVQTGASFLKNLKL